MGFDQIDRQFQKPTIKLECLECGGTAKVQLRSLFNFPHPEAVLEPWCDDCWSQATLYEGSFY